MLLELAQIGHEVEGRRLFEGFDLELAEGEVVCLRGASGSGKTTLLRLVAGLLPVQRGAVRLEGRSLEEVGACAWRTEVGFCPQGGPVMRGTPSGLLARVSGLAARRGRAVDDPREVASGWGLDPARWEREFAELSSGERQRVQLAIAVAGRPRVLLLDEPTSALDPAARDAVELSLRGQSALWVTHDDGQAARLGGRSVELGS